MSRYIDINQLLDEIGTSGRSAGDPWTLSRSYRTVSKRNSLQPSVVADLGTQSQELGAEIQASERIANANSAPSPTIPSGSGKSSSGSGLLGGLLNFFPLASGIAKFFGFGDSSSPPVLTPYQLPPSINFEGAPSRAASGVASLSYGNNGLPRTSVADLTHVSTAGEKSSNIIGELTSLAASPTPSEHTSTSDITRQIGSLATSSFLPQDSVPRTLPAADYLAGKGAVPENRSVSSAVSDSAAVTPNQTSSSPTASQQGQSILVQVQAMDSQSFMDHSHDIAQAVRQAMLNLNSLNDVILDL